MRVLETLGAEWLTGHEIAARLRERRAGPTVADVRLLPQMHRLEAAGILTAEWQEVAGVRRRHYRATQRATGAGSSKRPGGGVIDG
jgi:DNA-binding PadR family transcriptional regulator